jgi:gas vesicle protein
LTFGVSACYQEAYQSEENHMSEESSAGEKVVYLMLGAMIGAATALLLAPRSGIETRKLLASKAREGADLVTNSTKNVAGKTSDYVERGKELLQQQRDQLAAALEAGKQAYREEKEKA